MKRFKKKTNLQNYDTEKFLQKIKEKEHGCWLFVIF